ncbi:hypothetical protein PVAND_001156 [Polypedilum vanderplanki]|uniref:26S proteasome non-ATPase regulatory subunit 9 n=1 Tax=Polypedilum vanderplanki TaxID=319348 RepID=A0A9J6BMP0_POLVA|nr:hypothetical protein PVAND_001156 [Polypedilum vanderplanki]
MVSSTEGEQQRKQVLKLIEEKEKIEKKIEEYGVVLKNNNIGFHEPLVDEEGFPRNDIDVRSVRLARTQIICLQNDLKNLMKVIDEGLQKYFYDRKDVPEASSSKLPPQMKKLSLNENMRPFLVINVVDPNSPGEMCGVQVNDLICSFGSINYTNFKDLSQIGELVKNCEKQQVKITVRRNGNYMDLILVPKLGWGGNGFLGFKVAALPH